MAPDPPRRGARAEASRNQGSISTPSSASGVKTSRTQLFIDESDEEADWGRTPPPRSTRRESSISIPSDDEDEYAPSQADEDYEDDDVDSQVASRRKQSYATTSTSSRPLRTRSPTGSDDASASDNDMGDFPSMAPSRGHHAAWTREEDKILLDCVRKHGRQWPRVVKAYSKAAKGWPSRSVQACGKRFTKLQEQAVKKQRERARQGGTDRERGRGGAQTQGSSTSAMVARGGAASTRSAAGHRHQQRALLQSEEGDEGEDASFGIASGSQGQGGSLRGAQDDEPQAAYPYQIQPKQEIDEGADLLWSGMSASLNGGLFAAAENAHPPYGNANIGQGRDEVDCEVTHEEYGLTFKDVPCGSEIFIYSPHRYKIRGPSRSARARQQQQQQQQQQQEEEEAAFAFQVLDGSVRAMKLPLGSTTQISFDPPSMVFCGPDSFLVLFRL